jgi:hypothetical protein
MYNHFPNKRVVLINFWNSEVLYQGYVQGFNFKPLSAVNTRTQNQVYRSG